jgi:hypothetical protein
MSGNESDRNMQYLNQQLISLKEALDKEIASKHSLMHQLENLKNQKSRTKVSLI